MKSKRLKTINIICVIFALLFCLGCARVPWTKTDKAMFGAACAAQGYDFYTTNRALNRDHKMRSEWQWLYGSDNPSSNTLAISKAAQLGLAWIILDRTSSKWREIILSVMTGGWIFYGSQNK